MSLATCARRAGLAAAAWAALALPAAANDYVETEALFHARAIEAAWNTLADHITRDSTAAVSWTGTTPPASTGWLADWTARGLGARYCDSLLLVHVTAPSMKGTGTNLAAVQLAPHLEAEARNRDVPPLHWIDSGTAEGVLGRESVAIPACMGTVPSDRPALAGMVVDPFTVTTDLVTAEHQDRACPAGFHGDGQTFVREVTQKLNGRGDATGAPTTGPWSLLVDHCRADTVSWEYFRQSCTFTPGEPHTGTLTGEAVWRREKSVTSGGTSYGAPEFVSTTCWTDPNPATPAPTVTTSTTTRTRTVGCGSGYTGSKTQTRTISWRHLKWPWDSAATTQKVSQTNWATTASSCRKKPPPDDPPKDPPPDDPPKDDPPKDDPPKDDPPPDDPPKDDPPKDDPPKDDPPKNDPPPDDPPDDDPPPDDPPKDDPPKDDPPKDDDEEESTTERKCVDRDKGGGNCGGDSGGDGGRNGGDGVGGGWDTDGDGKADVADLSDVDEGDRSTANYVSGHTPIGRENSEPGGGDRGGNTSGERDGAPGGDKGSGDRGR